MIPSPNAATALSKGVLQGKELPEKMGLFCMMDYVFLIWCGSVILGSLASALLGILSHEEAYAGIFLFSIFAILSAVFSFPGMLIMMVLVGLYHKSGQRGILKLRLILLAINAFVVVSIAVLFKEVLNKAGTNWMAVGTAYLISSAFTVWIAKIRKKYRMPDEQGQDELPEIDQQ